MNKKNKIITDTDFADLSVECYSVADVSDALSIEDLHNYCDDENAADYGDFSGGVELMRGLLIDPKAKTITEVVYTDDYKNIYEHIGADCFDMLRLNQTTDIYVDDNGLSSGKDLGLFYVNGKYPAILAGKGLVLGRKGEHTVATDMDINELRHTIDFGYVARIPGGELRFVTDGMDFKRIPK
jgi:hypothetical protein